MYDDEQYPTAESAELWMYFEGKLREKRMVTMDRFLRDFAAVWHGVRDDKAPQDLHNETMELERQQQKAGSSISVAGLQIQCDENGQLTLIGSGSHYLIISAVYAQQFRDAINQIVPASDPGVIDINTNPPMFPVSGQMGARIPTNQELSMTQNELTAKALRDKKQSQSRTNVKYHTPARSRYIKLGGNR